MKCLVVGRGLAGSWLSWHLAERGHDVTVANDPDTPSASRVAAGLINPVTGTRPKSTWQGDILLPFARRAYGSLEDRFGTTLWTDRTIRRIFLTEKDKELWSNADARGINTAWTPVIDDVDGIRLRYGGVEYAGATIDTKTLIDSVARFLDTSLTVTPPIQTVSETDDYDLVFWCNGWSASRQHLWSWLPFQPVKGEIIDAEINGPALSAILIRSIWIVPDSNTTALTTSTQHVRIGATHDWDNLDTFTTDLGRTSLTSKAEELLGRSIAITGHSAGVRPAARSKRPFLGRHPQHSKHIIMNGLGSKGSLWAPWAASHLLSHIFDGEPLNEETDIKRWWHHV